MSVRALKNEWFELLVWLEDPETDPKEAAVVAMLYKQLCESRIKEFS